MDPPRSHKARRKGKEPMSEGADHRAKTTHRGENWTPQETSNLLNAIEQVQDRRGRRGFSFSSGENTEIFQNFKKGMKDSTRDKERVVNRIKVILSRFKLCDELANRSGGGWDDATNRPIAPSEKEYEDMIRAKGEKCGFLLRGNFPWYRQIESMLGGPTIQGEDTSEAWGSEEPTHCLLDSQMSIDVSSQGSSDEPDDGSARSTDRQRRSNSSIPTSGGSGSKRKSTTETSERNVRGKRYKERNKKKQSEVLEVANLGKQIVQCMVKDTELRSAPIDPKRDELTKVHSKLKQLQLGRQEHRFLFKILEKSEYKRIWFLMSDRDDILEYVREELGGNPSENVRPPTPPAYSAPNQGFPQPNPPANAVFSQFYPPPNAPPNNLFFRPNDPGWN